MTSLAFYINKNIYFMIGLWKIFAAFKSTVGNKVNTILKRKLLMSQIPDHSKFEANQWKARIQN